MQTSINLQNPYNYTIIPLLIVLFAIGIVTLYVYLSKKLKKTPILEQPEIKAIPEKNIKNIPAIKDKYLKQLDSIEYRYSSNMIGLRTAYQLVSQSIRLFIFEVTDISTQNYSLEEIKRLNIPYLYELIAEYYQPEFDKQSKGDLKKSIKKARNVILLWN